MSKSKKTAVSVLIVLSICITLFAGCASGKNDDQEISIAYQYGIAYIPLILVKELDLLESKIDPEITVNWSLLSSGQAVNEGLASGKIDAAAMGISPFITGVTQGVGYKIFSGMSSQPIELITNRESVRSLADVRPEDKIAMGSYGSMQHIILAMACSKELGDAHALDNNIFALSHPDAYSSLVSGSVDFHVATPPYLYIEQEQEGLYTVPSVAGVWPSDYVFTVAVATESFRERHPEVYSALVESLHEAIDYANEHPDEVAAMLYESQGIAQDDLYAYITSPSCIFSYEAKGVLELAEFMIDNGFADGELPKEEDCFFE